MRKVWVVALVLVAMWLVAGCAKKAGPGGAATTFSNINDSRFAKITVGMQFKDVLNKATEPILNVNKDGNGMVMFRSKEGYVYRVMFENWTVTNTEKVSDEGLSAPTAGAVEE